MFCGDVFARSGREAIAAHVPLLRDKLSLDFVVVNGENAAAGRGMTPEICQDFFAAGVDVITGGDHSWDQRACVTWITQEPRLLRPVNFSEGAPGKGATIFHAAGGQRVLVINLLARVFMKTLVDDPFATVRRVLSRVQMGRDVEAILVDFHGEATSEKGAMGHYLDGQVSVVAGTHTHIPTADERILNGGTAFQTDTGMTGDYDSVIGMAADAPIQRFISPVPAARMTPAEGEATLCGLFVETDDDTGCAKRVAPVRVGGRLSPSLLAL